MKVAYPKQKVGFISLVLLVFVVCTFASCRKKEMTGPQYRVLLINSYHFDYAHSSNSVQLYRDFFAEKGVNVDLRNVFLEFPYGVAEKQWEECIQPKLDSLAGWTPDLLILNNDFAVQVATLNPEWFRRFPAVYGGVTAPDSMLLDFFPNMAGFVCPPDYMANLRFIEKVTGQKEAVMELDYTYVDSLVRKHLQAEEQKFPEGYKITTASAASPHRNVSGDSTGVSGKLYLEEVFHQAKYKAHLQVLVDSYSDLFMNCSDLPQFTATDVRFANGEALLVGGYFPSLETQVRDQVDYAVQILQGASPKSLPRAQHQAAYYMDYQAMLRRDLSYDDWKDEAIILNVPFPVAHPVEFGVLIAVGLLMVILITWAIVQTYIYLAHRRINRVLQDLQKQKARRNQLLASSQSANWVLKGGYFFFDESFAQRWNLPSNRITLRDFYNFVHRSHLDEFREFLAKNKYRNQITVPFTFNEGKSFHWFDMNYKVMERDGEEVLLGLLMNMDQQKMAEDQLKKAQQATELVEMKEMFLANMNHDIRTPLSAIAGFAEVITDMGDELDDESMQAYSEIISQNSEVLLKLLDDVLNMRGDDLGKFRYYPKEVKVEELMQQAFNTNLVLCPQHIDFRILKGKENLKIYVDQERTMQVINNFLSNAFKCTPKGYVALGWQYMDVTNEVELFVIDTGVGIPIAQQRNLFDRYYKTHEGLQGTGLGLHISKTLVEDQQGHIDVRSTEGVGSRFSAFFKVCRMWLLLLGFGLGLTACQPTPLQQHPDHYFGLPALLLLLLIILVAYLTRRSNARRSKELRRLKQRLQHEIELGDMVLDTFKGTVFSYRHGALTMDESFMKRNKFKVVTLNDEQFRSFIHPDHMAEFDQLMESFQTPGTYNHHIFIKYMEDQTYHWSLMHYVVKAPGEVDGFSMMDDVAVMRELKIQTAQQQMKLAADKNDFLNNISFLVRGPLSSVLGFSELLSKHYQEYGVEERKEFCNVIRANSRKLLGTVNQVLELSRVESGRAEIVMETVDPKTTISNVFTRWQSRMDSKPEVELVYHPGREGLHIKANAVRLESVLDMLMKRALDNTEKGLVTIGWYYDMPSHEVVFYVEDTGNGINLDEGEDLFRQSGDLDLALAKSLVTHMSGKVEVQSQIGVGSRFLLLFAEITPPMYGYKRLSIS